MDDHSFSNFLDCTLSVFNLSDLQKNSKEKDKYSYWVKHIRILKKDWLWRFWLRKSLQMLIRQERIHYKVS